MNKNMHDAKRNKNDEFYTQISDIEKEVSHYIKHFENKIIYCNTDSTESHFVEFFKNNFHKFKLKLLINSCIDGYAESFDGHNSKRVCVDGDFRSADSVNILQKCDIVVSNPPFSLFREYVAQLIEYEKDFLIMGNNNAITYKKIFPLIKNNKMWLGYNSPKEFVQPDGTIKKFGNITWFTNMDVTKRNEDIFLYKDYYGNEENYSKYDNYDAIEVGKVKDIPRDYEGVMGVPITFLTKYNPEQFELIGLTTGRREFSEQSYPTKRYIDAVQYNKNGTTTNGSKINTRATLPINDDHDGVYYKAKNSNKKLKIVYARILIKNKNPELKKRGRICL